MNPEFAPSSWTSSGEKTQDDASASESPESLERAFRGHVVTRSRGYIDTRSIHSRESSYTVPLADSDLAESSNILDWSKKPPTPSKNGSKRFGFILNLFEKKDKKCATPGCHCASAQYSYRTNPLFSADPSLASQPPGSCACTKHYAGEDLEVTTRPANSFAHRIMTLLKIVVFGLLLPGILCNIPGANAQSAYVQLGSAPRGHQLTFFQSLVLRAGLQGAFETQPIAVLAPTDAVYQALPAPVYQALEAAGTETALNLVMHTILGESLSFADMYLRARLAGFVYAGSGERLALTYTTATGGTNNVFVAGVRILDPNIQATNGIIHIMENALLPDWFYEQIPGAPQPSVAPSVPTPGTEGPGDDDDDVEVPEPPPTLTILQRINQFPSLSQYFQYAMQHVGVTQVLSNQFVPLTVLVPNNDAFNILPAGLIDILTPDQLRDVLLYHIIRGPLSYRNLTGAAQRMESLQTEQGEFFNLMYAVDGSVRAETGTIIRSTSDNQATNGVFHVTTRVMVPFSIQIALPEDMRNALNVRPSPSPVPSRPPSNNNNKKRERVLDMRHSIGVSGAMLFTTIFLPIFFVKCMDPWEKTIAKTTEKNL